MCGNIDSDYNCSNVGYQLYMDGFSVTAANRVNLIMPDTVNVRVEKIIY